MAIPFLRIIFNQVMNIFIKQRNAVRREASMRLEKPELAHKLDDARDMALQLDNSAGSGQIIYTSKKDLLEQELDGLKSD